MIRLVLLVAAGVAATEDNCVKKQADDDIKTNSMIQMHSTKIKHGVVFDDEVSPDEERTKTYSMIQKRSSKVKQPLLIDEADDDAELSQADLEKMKRAPTIKKGKKLAKEVIKSIELGVKMKEKSEEDRKTEGSSTTDKLNKAKNEAKNVIQMVKKIRQSTTDLKNILTELGANADAIGEIENKLEEIRKIEQATVLNKGFAKLAYMKDDAKMEMLETMATNDLKSLTNLKDIQARMLEEKQKFKHL